MLKFQQNPSDSLKSLTKQQLELLSKQKKFWSYYNGDYQEHLQSRVLPNGTFINDNVSVPLARRIVQKGNNFLFGKGLTWQIALSGSTLPEQILSEIWGNEESQNSFLAELGINGGVFGDFYVQIISHQGNVLKLKNLNPLYVFPYYDTADDDSVFKFELRWTKSEKDYRILHNKLENGLQWDFVREVWDKQRWVMDSEVQIWDFDFPFVVHGKNYPNPNSYFGLSDLEDIQLNDTINQVSSNLNKIIRIFAHPVVWGTGFGSNALDIDTSKMITTTNETARLSALELGRDLADSQEFLKYLRTMLSEVTAVPEADPDRLKIGAQSGFSLEVLFNDLVLKTGIKRQFYGKALIELNRRLLAISGLGDNIQTKLYWPNPLPRDYVSETTSDTFDLSSGLTSKKSLATKRGIDFDLEKELMQAESVSTATLGEALITAFRNGNS